MRRCIIFLMSYFAPQNVRHAHMNESRRAYVYIFGVAQMYYIFSVMFRAYALVSRIGEIMVLLLLQCCCIIVAVLLQCCCSVVAVCGKVFFSGSRVVR